MLICCEQCSYNFEVKSSQLTQEGTVVLCDKCQHPHQVFRKVVPFKVLGIKEKHHARQWTAEPTVTMEIPIKNDDASVESGVSVVAPQADHVIPFPVKKRAGMMRRLVTWIAIGLILLGAALIVKSLTQSIPPVEPQAIEPL